MSEPLPLPAEGGRYLREADGSLRLLGPDEPVPAPVAEESPAPSAPKKKGG